jgi:hypothetical protein
MPVEYVEAVDHHGPFTSLRCCRINEPPEAGQVICGLPRRVEEAALILNAPGGADGLKGQL